MRIYVIFWAIFILTNLLILNLSDFSKMAAQEVEEQKRKTNVNIYTKGHQEAVEFDPKALL